MNQPITRSLQLKLIVWFGRIHTTILRLSRGKMANTLAGLDMLLLTTIGRRTGRPHHNPLLYIKRNKSYYCAASFGGSQNNPDWVKNLMKTTQVNIMLKGRSFPAVGTILSGTEREMAWDDLTQYYPPFKKYQTRTNRTIPVIKFIQSNTDCKEPYNKID